MTSGSPDFLPNIELMNLLKNNYFSSYQVCRDGSRYVDGFMALWCYDFMVLWLCGFMVLWLYGCMIL